MSRLRPSPIFVRREIYAMAQVKAAAAEQEPGAWVESLILAAEEEKPKQPALPMDDRQLRLTP